MIFYFIYPLFKNSTSSSTLGNKNVKISAKTIYLLYDVCGMLMTFINNGQIIEFTKVLFGPLHHADTSHKALVRIYKAIIYRH